jgi:hypothetical protein
MNVRSCNIPSEGNRVKRRQVLRGIAALPAAGLLKAQQPVVPPKPTPAAVEQIPVIEATVADMAASPVHRYFKAEQFAALKRLSETIAPAANGIPGAEAAGTPEFLDFLLSESPEARQHLYANGLEELNRRAQQRFRVAFADTSPDQVNELLAPLRQRWSTDTNDEFTLFLRAAKEDILQATEDSYEWIRAVSKRVRGASGVGTYWRSID